MAGVFQPNVFQPNVFQEGVAGPPGHVFQCNVFQLSVFQNTCVPVEPSPPTLPKAGGRPIYDYARETRRRAKGYLQAKQYFERLEQERAHQERLVSRLRLKEAETRRLEEEAQTVRRAEFEAKRAKRYAYDLMQAQATLLALQGRIARAQADLQQAEMLYRMHEEIEDEEAITLLLLQ